MTNPDFKTPTSGRPAWTLASTGQRNSGWGDFFPLSLAWLRACLVATTVLLSCCGPAAVPSPPLSRNQKIMAAVRKSISTASTMTFGFAAIGVCGPAVYQVHGSALVEFADTLDRLIAGPGVMESPPMLFIDIYRGEELVEQLQILEHLVVRHLGLDADLSFFAKARIAQWFKRQSIPLRCLEFNDVY